MTEFGSFDNSTCKRVLDLLKPGDLTLGQVVIKRVAVVLFTFFVYVNYRKYNNTCSFDSKLTRKLLYCESITKSEN